MTLFFTLLLSVYVVVFGGTHVYLYHKLYAIWQQPALLITLLAALVIAPVVVGVLAHFGHVHCVKLVAQVSYVWMGFAFLFFCSALLFDMYELLLVRGSEYFAFDAARGLMPASLSGASPTSSRWRASTIPPWTQNTNAKKPRCCKASRRSNS
ncbi:MAG: hypothetical protein HY273_12100 [Gammaproteobacteria bacterium]|nr:hypothetical protein [Gammaproteobacteria bacterium]